MFRGSSPILLTVLLAAACAEPRVVEPSNDFSSSPRSRRASSLEGANVGRDLEPRWTPAMHAAARALADADHATGRQAVLAAMRGSHRAPGAAERDRYRHPAETLDFFGVTPTMTVFDVAPGAGWYTELLAPTLAKHGEYITTVTDPHDGAGSNWGTSLNDRFVAHLREAPELYGKVRTLVVAYGAPKIDLDGTVDMVLMMREVHMMKNWGTLDAWLRASFRMLKPNGILGIEDHRAAPGTDPATCATTGYLPEAWVIEQVEASGFKLVARSEINANPSDTRDHPKGVWTLPPELLLGDVDREKYMAIGESDRMTLKFVKVAPR